MRGRLRARRGRVHVPALRDRRHPRRRIRPRPHRADVRRGGARGRPRSLALAVPGPPAGSGRRGSAPPPRLQVGFTPVVEAPALAKELGLGAFFVKDDGRNPTASFKDRASSVGVTRARWLGRSEITCSSTGNAASSLAGFAAEAGMKAFIFVPASAPEAKVAQLLVYGARVFLVEGPYEDAFRVCQAAVAAFGWYNRNCAINPYLVEGKKTCGLEIAEQMRGEPARRRHRRARRRLHDGGDLEGARRDEDARRHRPPAAHPGRPGGRRRAAREDVRARRRDASSPSTLRRSPIPSTWARRETASRRSAPCAPRVAPS